MPPKKSGGQRTRAVRGSQEANTKDKTELENRATEVTAEIRKLQDKRRPFLDKIRDQEAELKRAEEDCKTIKAELDKIDNELEKYPDPLDHDKARDKNMEKAYEELLDEQGELLSQWASLEMQKKNGQR